MPSLLIVDDEPNLLYSLEKRLRSETLEQLLARRPEEVVRRAVRGMLPRNRLGEQMSRKLHVYAGAEHPHAAQKPEPMRKETES